MNVFAWASLFLQILPWKCLLRIILFYLFIFLSAIANLRGVEWNVFSVSLFPCVKNEWVFTSPCVVFYFPVRTVARIKDDCESFGSDCKTNMSCAAALRKLFFFPFSIRMDDLLLFLDGLTRRSDKLRRCSLVVRQRNAAIHHIWLGIRF